MKIIFKVIIARIIGTILCIPILLLYIDIFTSLKVSMNMNENNIFYLSFPAFFAAYLFFLYSMKCKKKVNQPANTLEHLLFMLFTGLTIMVFIIFIILIILTFILSEMMNGFQF